MNIRQTTIGIFTAGAVCIGCQAPVSAPVEQFDGAANLLSANERALTRMRSAFLMDRVHAAELAQADGSDEIRAEQN